jgi:hypothetical protein
MPALATTGMAPDSLGVIELKNPGDENATLDGAFNQLQTYKSQITSKVHLGLVEQEQTQEKETPTVAQQRQTLSQLGNVASANAAQSTPPW